ncbi:MAG TPA: cytochrome C, partial [Sedimenticola sp.]|nr:cytochrome C [Sedimenticola sp.]
MSRKNLGLAALFAGCFTVTVGMAEEKGENGMDQAVLHPAIPLLDEQGMHVLESGKPYSPRMSCGTGGCHDYESITHAFHFETGRDEASDDFGEQTGLPQLVSPGYFGGYNCMGGNNPEQLAKKHNRSAADFADYGSAGIVKRCISCHAGGGWMEKDRNGRRYDETDPATVKPFDGDYYNRGTTTYNKEVDDHIITKWNWKKSGVVENDCFMCHLDYDKLKNFDPALEVGGGPDGYDNFRELRRNKLVREHAAFRYAATAILEFFNLNPTDDPAKDMNLVTFRKRNVEVMEGRRGPEVEFDLQTGKGGVPVITWNARAFDDNGKVEIPMLRFPGNDNCMQCHSTSNSRRGFYGFGEDAASVYDEEGMLEEDYKDDVHYGLTWTEPNGESRLITSCNACHARAYYRTARENTDLDADHNFLKGNSDMDVHNDRDYQPDAKSCLYCHDTAEDPAIPSGHDSMLAAHLSRWSSAGDLRGYSRDALEGITDTHLQTVSCQACHITDKQSRGRPIQIMYRYRREEDGKLRIVPNNPRARYYWKDRNSRRVLTRTERNSVYRLVTGEHGEEYGEIFDPTTGETLGTAEAYESHGSLRFRDPSSYAGFLVLKQAYDRLLAGKGVENPDTVIVWTEINNYLMSHNTRPATSALQCDDCHSRKQNGSISSFLSPDGLLGEGNVREVTELIDRRLVDEGLVVLDLPYMKVDDKGRVTENVSDILYHSLVNPSMTRLNAEIAVTQRGTAVKKSLREGLGQLGIRDRKGIEAVTNAIPGADAMYLYQPNYGVAPVRSAAVLTGADFLSDLFMPYASFRITLAQERIGH